MCAAIHAVTNGQTNSSTLLATLMYTKPFAVYMDDHDRRNIHSRIMFCDCGEEMKAFFPYETMPPVWICRYCDEWEDDE